MSNLNSVFDIVKGWPAGSALELSAKPNTTGITEGKIVALRSVAPYGGAGASTVLDPAIPAADIDMFIDPAVGTDFVTAAITDDDVIDTSHSITGLADMLTQADGTTIFNTGYAGSHGLRGVVGKKRLRTTSAGAFSTARAAKVTDYAVRVGFLKAEDPTSSAMKADVDGIVWANNGGFVQLQNTGAYASCLAGDIAHVTGAHVAGNNGGFIVTAAGADTLDLGTLVFAADAHSGLAGFQVQVYRLTKSVVAATAAHATQTITLAASGLGTAAAAGDAIFVLQDGLAATNIGMWIVDSKPDANTVKVVASATYDLLDSAASVNAVLVHTKKGAGNTALTVRKRLTRLVDTAAHFHGVVTPARDDIVMPWPVDIDPTHFDTTTTRWPVGAVVSDTTIDATLTALQELAPQLFVAGYAANAPYRIDIYDDTAEAYAASSTDAQATNGSINPPDQLWLVIQGNDQYDGSFTNRLALLKLGTGVAFMIASTIADTLLPGDLVYSNAGVLAKVTRATFAIAGNAKYSDHKQPVGQVALSNGVAGAGGRIIVIS